MNIGQDGLTSYLPTKPPEKAAMNTFSFVLINDLLREVTHPESCWSILASDCRNTTIKTGEFETPSGYKAKPQGQGINQKNTK